MVGEQQLIHGLSGLADTLGIGLDDHAVLGFHHAGSLKVLCRWVDLLNKADTACTVLVDTGQIA